MFFETMYYLLFPRRAQTISWNLMFEMSLDSSNFPECYRICVILRGDAVRNVKVQIFFSLFSLFTSLLQKCNQKSAVGFLFFILSYVFDKQSHEFIK